MRIPLAISMLFATPFSLAFWSLYLCSGLTVMGVTLCVMAFASALEEMVIVVKSRELNRNCKSIFLC